MKKILIVFMVFATSLQAQIKIKDLPTTTTGSTGDFLLKDDAAGTSGSTKKISVDNLISTYSLTVNGGTVQSVTVTPNSGVSASVSSPTVSPVMTFSLGDITPNKVNGNTITTGTGTITAVSTSTLTGNNTGDQDLSGYIPYTGASTNADLNQKNITNINRLGTDSISGDAGVNIEGLMNVDSDSASVCIGTKSASARFSSKNNIPNRYSMLGLASSGSGSGGLFFTTGGNAEYYMKNTAGNTMIYLNTNGSSWFLGGSIGVGTNPNGTSILDLSSTTKGFLAPRMTTGERDAIVGAATGLMVYNTTLSSFNYHNGSAWVTVGRSITVQTATTLTITPTTADDFVTENSLTGAVVIANPTGTWVEGQTCLIRIKDDGTARAITFGGNYVAYGAALPTTTTISKWLMIGLVYNAIDSKWSTWSSVQQ